MYVSGFLTVRVVEQMGWGPIRKGGASSSAYMSEVVELMVRAPVVAMVYNVVAILKRLVVPGGKVLNGVSLCGRGWRGGEFVLASCGVMWCGAVLLRHTAYAPLG